jgi:hypothetical protein
LAIEPALWDTMPALPDNAPRNMVFFDNQNRKTLMSPGALRLQAQPDKRFFGSFFQKSTTTTT